MVEPEHKAHEHKPQREHAEPAPKQQGRQSPGQSPSPAPGQQKSANQQKGAKNPIGLTVKKSEDFPEWYQQLILKANLIEYSQVSGCIVFRPRSYSIWEKIQQFIDKEIKKLGVKNAYFPLLIPENLLVREKEHVEGFSPEVAWVTEAGNSKLPERLAIRPTSETIMYDSYRKWIRSHKDLPLRLNQWCSVVRWEFKNPVPFLRTREFLWQEGHTAFATKAEADEEARQILDIYRRAYEDVLAVPVLCGTKSVHEKFAGADYSLSTEALFPNGKAVQAATSHHLGQNFSKSFEIEFMDEKGEKRHPFQNSWGFSTRCIGILIGVHSDDKGLIIPPKAAETHVAIVPILFEESKARVLQAARELKEDLEDDYGVLLDDRDDCSAGWKFAEHELNGVCLRVELGPKDLDKGQAVVVRRDTGEKRAVALASVHDEVRAALDAMQSDLFKKAHAYLHQNIVKCETFDELKAALDAKKIGLARWCGEMDCEESLKDETGGGKSLTIPFEQGHVSGKCVRCNNLAKVEAYFGKSY